MIECVIQDSGNRYEYIRHSGMVQRWNVLTGQLTGWQQPSGQLLWKLLGERNIMPRCTPNLLTSVRRNELRSLSDNRKGFEDPPSSPEIVPERDANGRQNQTATVAVAVAVDRAGARGR